MALSYILAVIVIAVFTYLYFFEYRKYNYQSFYLKQGGFMQFNSGQDFLAELVSDQSITGDITSHYKKMLVQKDARFFISHIKGRPLIVLNDVDMIREVLSNPDRFPKDPYFVNILKYIGTKSLIFSEGEVWRSHRKLLLCGLTMSFVQNFVPYTLELTKDLCTKVKTQNLKEVDIVTEIEIIIGKVFGRLLFGTAFKNNIVDKEIDLVNAPQRGIEELFKELVRASLTPGSNKEASLTNKGNEALVLIQKTKHHYREFISNSKKNHPNIDRISFIYMLIEQQRLMPDNCFDDEEIVDEFMALAGMAGYSTSQQISMALYNLSQQPFSQAKLLSEVEENLKSQDDFSFQRINKMDFLHSFMKESLRLTNPKGILPRIAANNERVQGINIEKGHTIVIMPELMHIDPNFYENPEKFDRNRWKLENEKQKKHETVFSDLAFSSGPKHCLGQNFSNLISKVIVSVIISQFELKSSGTLSGLIHDCSLFGSKHMYSLKLNPR